uniref:tetratricopeptide repeat protein n=1 Tax=Thaumasiovibrio occultus TaxID=1891184 RepID=UPI000B35ED5D|nr:hypothetical protein [Thaumasiovibrio occultus]
MKRCSWLVAVLALSGCAQQASLPPEIEEARTEAIVASTNDPAGAVAFYKQRLASEDSADNRYKLVESYLAMQDADSALFYLQPLVEKEQLSAQGFFLYGKALALHGQYLDARFAVTEALIRNPDFAQAHNFLGVLDAGEGRFLDARDSFNRARALLLDDITVKNNLAVLDIYQQDYQAAYNRLKPLWIQGNEDEQVRANLLVATAKLGYVEEFVLLLGREHDDFTVYSLYQTLSASEFKGGIK